MNPPSLWPLPESNRHPIMGPHFECGAYPNFAKGPNGLSDHHGRTCPGMYKKYRFWVKPLLRRPDSNGDYRNQNPGCCRYTTAQYLLPANPVKVTGFGTTYQNRHFVSL